jgi:hypothetical protein
MPLKSISVNLCFQRNERKNKSQIRQKRSKKMKKWLTTICAIVLMAGVAQAKDFNAWLLGDSDSLTARLGYDITPNVEVGGEVAWLNLDEVPGNAGIYGIYKFPDAVNVPNPLPLEWLPKTLMAMPYLGMQVGVDILNKGTFVGPIAGLVIQDIIVVEYEYLMTDFQLGQMNNEHRVSMGLCIRF